MKRYRPLIGSLISDALTQATQLLRTEIALVRLELTEKLTLVLTSLVGLTVACVLILVAIVLLLQGLVEMLVAKGLSASTANFAVGGGTALIAVIAIAVAARNQTAAKLKPTRSLRQVNGAREIMRGQP